MRRVIAAAIIAVFGVTRAEAAPPQKGSDDYERLMPYADWIAGQHTPTGGGLCCSLSDCRVVAFRVVNEHYEALIEQSDSKGFTKFEGAPNTYLAVPDSAITHSENVTGEAIACWSKAKFNAETLSNGFYCFMIPDLT